MSESEIQGWARELARRKLVQREAAAAADRKILSDRQLLEDAAPAAWLSLVAELRRALHQLTLAMDGEVAIRMEQPSPESLALVATATGADICRMRFEPAMKQVLTTYSTYRLRVVGVADLAWEDSANPGRTTAETIAIVTLQRAFQSI